MENGVAMTDSGRGAMEDATVTVAEFAALLATLPRVPPSGRPPMTPDAPAPTDYAMRSDAIDGVDAAASGAAHNATWNALYDVERDIPWDDEDATITTTRAATHTAVVAATRSATDAAADAGTWGATVAAIDETLEAYQENRL